MICPRFEMQQEPTAANARGLRLDKGQDHLDCDCGIDSASACSQDIEAGLCRVRVSSANHVIFGVDRLFFGEVEDWRIGTSTQKCGADQPNEIW